MEEDMVLCLFLVHSLCSFSPSSTIVVKTDGR